MSEWYLYADNGQHRGPMSTDALLEAVRTGEVARDARVSRAGKPEWEAIDQVAELVARLSAPATQDCYRVVDGAFTKTTRGTPEFGTTMLIMKTTRPDKT